MKPVRDDEVVLIVVLAKGFVERVVAVIDPIISVITTTLLYRVFLHHCSVNNRDFRTLFTGSISYLFFLWLI